MKIPKSIEEDVRARIKNYFETVLPFMLRHTMHHEIAAVTYDTNSGDNTITRTTPEPFSISDEKELQTYGIQTILTTPENLTIDSINKYLELKSRGMI